MFSEVADSTQRVSNEDSFAENADDGAQAGGLVFDSRLLSLQDFLE